MTRKSKRIMKRILAVVMAVALVPSNSWGTAGVVMAEETSEVFVDEETDVTAEDVSTENVLETQGDSDKKEPLESFVDANDAESTTLVDVEDSTSASDIRVSKEVKEVEVDAKEDEKVSTETDNKATVAHVHNFTTEYKTDDPFFTISGNLQNQKTEVKYTDHTGTELSLTCILKLESSAGTVTFNAESAGTLILITEASKKTFVDDTTPSSDDKGVLSVSLEAGSHTIKKSGAQMLYYIAFITEVGEPANPPKATPESNTIIKVGQTITLSSPGTTDVTIYYTTDGSDPRTSSSKTTYTDPIKITSGMIGSLTIKAYAGGGDYSASTVETFEYTVEKSDTQLEPPTAEPGDTEKVTVVERGATVTLTGSGTSIRYTINDGEMLTYTDPIPIEEDNTTIKAIAVAANEDDNSAEAVFRYEIKKSEITVADDSKDIIKSVEKNGDVSFENASGKEVYTIQLSAQKKTPFSSDAITENLKKDGEALSYDLKLMNEENENDAVSIKEGTLKVKVLYSIATSTASRKNEIIVLNGETKVTEVRKDVDGILFSVDSVADPYTIIINPVPVGDDDDDEMTPKTYILDAEELELTKEDLTTNTPYGTEDYFTLMCTNGTKPKTAAIVKIADVTTGSGDEKVNCYTNLTWSDEILNVIGGGRTQCVRITGGGIATDSNQPANCIKITTKLDATKFKEANVVVYFTPKGTTSRKITVKADNGGQLGDAVATSSTGVTRANVGKAEFKLTTAGTYYFGFDGDGGIIPYMEVTEVPKVPEIDAPTADPVSGTALNRKSTITLKATDADIYYTTNGVDPIGTVSSDEKKYTEPLAVTDLPVNNNKITIKAIAISKAGAGQGRSGVATFEYAYDPNAVAITIAEDSKDIIKSVEAVGNVSEVTRGSDTLDVTDITVKVKKLTDTEIDADVKAAAEELATDAEKSNIQYYNISLILNEETQVSADEVTFSNANAALRIKMLYSLFNTDALGDDVTNRNEIFVLHKTDTIDESKIVKERVTSQNAEDAGFSFEADSFSPYTVVVNPVQQTDGAVTITDAAGYEEGVYAEWEAVDGADGYKVYVSPTKDGEYYRIDNELIREYEDYWRVDAVGLRAGNYYLKIEAVKVETEGDDENVDVLAETVEGPLKVTNYDRSGFAFSSDSPLKSGSGAYNDDGSLKEDAQVIYVTKDTAKTCKAIIHKNGASKPAVEVVGLQSILDAKQKKGTEKDIIDIRIIGRVSKDDLDHISSKAEGLQVKGAANYNEMNITIEGIGEDAVVHGFGFLIRNCGNVELRNFAIMAFMDDGVSMDTANCNIWVHDLDIFYGSTGGDSDQAKGDGSVDVKGKSTYVTISYNHFWDSGKCSLCGMSDSEEFMVTYHHNWFDHSDSRHPRIRVGSIHVYNNYFDGNSKYGVGVTKGSSAFVEANYFRNCKYPMLISQQGSDLAGGGDGTFSGEPGGIIKAYANKIEGAQRLVYANKANGSMAANATEFDAYLADSRDEKVPNTYKTLLGGTSYNNFDTGYDLGVKTSAIDSAEDVQRIVTEKAGRLNGGDFEKKSNYTISSSDTSYDVDTTLKADVVNYQSSIVFIGGIKGVSGGSSGEDIPGGSTTLGGELYAHNFTTDGFTSDSFFTITGQEQSNPATVKYVDPNGNSLTLTKALKMENATEISFSAGVAGTLYIVTNGITKVDNVNQEPADGVIEMYIDAAGSHSITMGEAADIYYIAYLEDTYDENDVLAPTFSVLSGKLPTGTKITLTCKTAGAEIHYTTDGTTPSASSPKYTAPFAIDGVEGDQVTVKAIAIKGDAESTIVSCIYTLMDSNKYVAEPVPSPAQGTIEKGTTVSLSTLTDGAKIYITYKTDGTQPADPTEESEEYTGPIIINRTTTIKAIAIKGDIKSEIKTFAYTVSSGGSSGTTTGAKIFEFNPTKIGFTLDEKDSSDSTKKLHTLPEADTQYGTDNYFTIGNKDNKAKITETTLKAPAGNQTGITDYTLRYQFGGSAATPADPKAIRFTTYGTAKVTICACLLNDTARKLYVDSDDKNCAPVKGEAKEFSFDVEKGAHAIYAKDGDIAILYVIVEDTDVPGAGEPSGGDDAADKVSEPVASLPSGTYAKGTKVSLGAELGAKIYYTTDDSEPKANSTLYTTEFVLEEDITIKAIAELDGTFSETATFEYKVVEDIPGVKDPLSKPEASPAPVDGETYPVGLRISLTSEEGGTIYYTLDGSEPKKEDGQPSETSKPLAEGESITLNTVGIHTIKAFAVKEDYPSSDTAVFTYTIAENSSFIQLKKPTIAPESKDVEKGDQITVTIMKAEDDPEGTDIYYTTDGSVPKKETGKHYTDAFTLTVNETTTVMAIAIKEGAISSPIDSVTYTVKEDDATREGLWVELKNKKEVYTYTGSAIKPEIVVGNYGDVLVEGVDYTVTYKNNINAVTGDTKDNKKPQIIVTGKGNLTGKATQTFTIHARPITDVVVAGVENVEKSSDNDRDNLLVVENTKPSPTLYYGSVKLTKKDYTLSDDAKCAAGDTGKQIEITGTGNYVGTLKYNLKVISKTDLKKFTVALTAPDYTYNGSSQILTNENVVVKDADGTTSLTKDTNYAIVYQNDTTNAGKVKFTVVGLGLYSGAVTKTYTIKPLAVTSGLAFTGVGESYPYVGTGVTIPTAGITYNGAALEQGKDYKLTYGSNKKVGEAKISATFMGNYKGSKIEPKAFTITQGTLNNQTQGLKIVVADKVYNKPGVYKSVPYVSVNGVEVKASEYIVKYYTNADVSANGTITVDSTAEMGSKNKIELSETEPSKPVYVEITGKGKNYADTMKLTASYNVHKASESAFDLSKAKLTVYKNWDIDEEKAADKANKSNKMEYSGKTIEPGVMIELKDAAKTKLYPADVKNLIAAKKITVQYTNNVEKGKATIVINGNGTDYVGGKTVTFSITTKSLQNEADLLTDLFKNINNIIKG